MKTKTKKPTKYQWSLRRLFSVKRIIIVVIVLLLLAAGVYGWCVARRYQQVATYAASAQVRDLIVQANRGLVIDAPRDPMSGDTYFPEARLRLAAGENMQQLQYFYWPSVGGSTAELHITNRNVVNQKIAQLYAMPDTTQMFERVPGMQACTRGVTISFAQLTDTPEMQLKHVVSLAADKSAYLYLDNGCPELSELVDQLKGVTAY